MRVLFIIPRMGGGGAERVVANLANAFCKQDQVGICTLVSSDSFYKLENGITVYSNNIKVNRKNKLSTIISYAKNFTKGQKHIKTTVKTFKPDCIISFLRNTDILTYSATKRKKNIIKIYSERCDPTRIKKYERLILKKVYKSADLFVCQSKKVFDYYSYIPRSKKAVIPNPLDEKVLPKPSLSEKNHNIVSVGRLSEQKNFELLINSYINSINELPGDCNLVIYGNGPLKNSLQSIIKESGMKDRIILASTSRNVISEIRDSALFVTSSKYEGFPNALLEAMAVGLPVISTDFFTGTARELIKSENGIIVPVENTERLSEAIITIMSDEKLRKKMRKNNIYVRKEYDIDIISKKWKKEIERHQVK